MTEVKRGRGRPPKIKIVDDQITDAVTVVEKPKLSIFKTHPGVTLPKFQTEQSACFDLAFSGKGKTVYKGYNMNNATFERTLHNGNIFITPGDRIMVPTGLILDIPKGYSVRVHPRSGLSLKQGLVLINSEGVIDSDYVEELFLLMVNTSANGQWINEGDRLCQAELTKLETYDIMETMTRPRSKTDRIGGLGSTGMSNQIITIKI